MIHLLSVNNIIKKYNFNYLINIKFKIIIESLYFVSSQIPYLILFFRLKSRLRFSNFCKSKIILYLLYSLPLLNSSYFLLFNLFLISAKINCGTPSFSIVLPDFFIFLFLYFFLSLFIYFFFNILVLLFHSPSSANVIDIILINSRKAKLITSDTISFSSKIDFISEIKYKTTKN